MLGDLSEKVEDEDLSAEEVIDRMIRNGKPKSKTQLTREQIEAAIIKKRAAEKKALDIIHRLMVENADERTLKQSAEHLTQIHYNDLVEERAICGLCGYAICENELHEQRSCQKYKIDLRSKKVYELTERKKFCSDGCFQASDHFKNQLATCPSWMLDLEKKTEIVLIPHRIVSGKQGDEVLKLNRLKPPEKSTNQSQKRATAASGSTETTAKEADSKTKEDTMDTTQDLVAGILKKMTVKERDSEAPDENTTAKERTNKGNIAPSKFRQEANRRKVNKESKDHPKACVESNISDKNNALERTQEGTVTEGTGKLENNDKGVGNSEESRKPDRQEEKAQKLENENKEVNEKIDHPFAAIFRMEQNLRDWVTPDTFKLILPQEKLRKILRLKGDSYLEWQASAGPSVSDPEFRNRYAILCRRLDLQEIDEALFGKEEDKVELQPLPTYETLIKEHEQAEMKVAAFLKGKEVLFRDEVSQKHKRNVKEREDLQEPSLPLLDKHNQMELRREIVNHHLEGVLHDAVKSLHLPSYKRTWEMTKALVHTFELTANNITYSPPIWTLLGLAMLYLLSLNDRTLTQALKEPAAQQWLSSVLSGYGLDLGYLHRLGSYLTDLDYILSKCSAPTFGTIQEKSTN